MDNIRITSFSIDWYNWSCCCADDEVHEKTTIYLNKTLIKINKFNGLEELLEEHNCLVSKDNIKNFFQLLESIDQQNKWKQDYCVEVCDGSAWEIRLRYSDRTIKLIKGTIEKPPLGNKIDKCIRDMLLLSHDFADPILFGC